MDARSILAIIALLAFSTGFPWVDFFAAMALGGTGTKSAVATGGRADDGSQSATQSSGALQPPSRLLLVRNVSGEYAKLVQSLPAGKHGFKVSVGAPINPQKLRDALRLNGTAATQGDTVQITSLEFRTQQIVLDVNGGGKKHFHWRQHLEIGIGGDMPDDTVPYSGPPEVSGATIILDYGRPLPDMSPDELKHDLSMVFDFSKEHSATVNWVDTLEPQFQEGIKDHQAVVGMDQEMVIAAVGRPDHKVRERDPDGQETEDWIYGTPPGRTVFVTFAGDTVIRVKQFN